MARLKAWRAGDRLKFRDAIVDKLVLVGEMPPGSSNPDSLYRASAIPEVRGQNPPVVSGLYLPAAILLVDWIILNPYQVPEMVGDKFYRTPFNRWSNKSSFHLLPYSFFHRPIQQSMVSPGSFTIELIIGFKIIKCSVSLRADKGDTYVRISSCKY